LKREPSACSLAVQLEAHDLAGQQAQARRAAVLFALVEQHLLADAHAHHRTVLHGAQQRFLGAGFAQAGHAVAHRALPRQHDAVGRIDVVRLVRHQDVGFRRRGAQGLRHRAQVAQPIDHYDLVRHGF
jgi:hypothetical protein